MLLNFENHRFRREVLKLVLKYQEWEIRIEKGIRENILELDGGGGFRTP